MRSILACLVLTDRTRRPRNSPDVTAFFSSGVSSCKGEAEATGEGSSDSQPGMRQARRRVVMRVRAGLGPPREERGVLGEAVLAAAAAAAGRVRSRASSEPR